MNTIAGQYPWRIKSFRHRIQRWAYQLWLTVTCPFIGHCMVPRGMHKPDLCTRCGKTSGPGWGVR